jgi:hypothetical protein
VIGADHALPDVLQFIDGFDGADAGMDGGGSTVAENGASFELSVSSRDLASVRILVEARAYGESIIGNLRRNLDAFLSIHSFHGVDDLEPFCRFLQILNPPGELFSSLQWKFAFYTSLRTDGTSRSIRCYFNLLWGSPGHRFVRVNDALRFLDCSRFQPCTNRLSSLLEGWGELVGLSCDIRGGVILPAKLHFSIARQSRYRMSLLQNWLGLSGHTHLVRWFMDLHPHQRIDAIPYLLSLDFGCERPRSLKIDLVLRGLSALQRDEITSTVIGEVNANGMQATLASLDDCVFSGQLPPAKQYLGISLERDGSPYVNAYYSVVHQPLSVATGSAEDAVRRGLAVVRTLQSASGGFGFESVDLGCRGRQVPDTGDVYMTAFIHQCLDLYWHGKETSLANACIEFILSRREKQGWRYLPELPLDVDDTAMAMISLQRQGIEVPNEVVIALADRQQLTGGFRTFYDMESDAEHFAVTANAVHALWNSDRRAAQRGLKYLMCWLEEPLQDALKWMYSALLPMYLLARGSEAMGEDATVLRSRIVTFVLGMRRDDGLWGNGSSECVETALALLALHGCGHHPIGMKAVIDYLRQSQGSAGDWPWAPIFSDGDGQWFGQRALSTVLCCAAVHLAARSDS